MRKVFILGVILLSSLSVTEVAQCFRRTDKTPDFFVPQGALTTKAQPEKLPNVKQMQYQGQQAPVVIEIEQARLARIEAAKQQKEQEQQRLERQQKLEQMKAQRAAQTQERLKKLQDRKNSPSTQTPETAKPVIKIDENTDIHTRIIQEYVVDLEHISRGETINNKRLNNMLSDWTDRTHLVE